MFSGGRIEEAFCGNVYYAIADLAGVFIGNVLQL